MSRGQDAKGPSFHAHFEHRVHPGLRIEATLALSQEIGVLFGPSGAGKSSILKLIAGLWRPQRGFVQLGTRVLFDAEQRVNVPLRLRRISMIFQHDLLFPHRDVAGNIRFGLKGWPRRAIEVRLEEVSVLCGVDHLLARRPETLSGGERQRVGLARALAPRPGLLLCDEPFSALDQEARSSLAEQLRAVQRAERIPILYVTHSPAEAIALGSTLFLVENGRIADQGEPLDVLSRRRSGFGTHLEGVRNVMRGVVEGHAPDHGATSLRLEGGPSLIIPFEDRPVGALVLVAVRADEILLAKGSVEGLSARNVLAGTVERIIPHGPEAEVLVRTDSIRWIVSVVAPALSALALQPGSEIRMIVKARSCHILEDVSSPRRSQSPERR